MKTIMIVWLLVGRGQVVFQYAMKFDNEVVCQKAAELERDTRTGWSITYPVRHADCVIEVKK